MVKFLKRKKVKPQYSPEVEKAFADRRKAKTGSVFEFSQPILQKIGILIGALLVLAVWFFAPFSRVESITVTGNRTLSREYVCDAAGISEDSRFYLCLPFVLKYKLEKDPMIAEAKEIVQVDGGIIRIEIEEKKAIGYRSDDDLTVLFSDLTTAPMKQEYMGLISRIPCVTGFEEPDQQRNLINAVAKLDRDTIATIAEITQYSMPYDNETLKILMGTGTYVIAGYNTVQYLKQFPQLYAHQKQHSWCLYAQYRDESKAVMVSRPCPWDITDTGREYWKDENGEVIHNKYGDQVVKQYYKDASGQDAKDAEGNSIPIPIDEEGMEQIDENFQEHYELGFYESGVLELPEEEYGEDE